ncbi:MAG: S41 family peptidase [Solirubrobacterales bacterium]|nr:S41 family peptidase [Solirubrobacterales bacterium]
MITSDRIVRRGLAGFGAIVLAMIILLAGIWLGGHPGDLPSPLRGGFFENRSLALVNQALNILTTRYYRPLNRSSLVGLALSGMVAGLDDPYSRYLDPEAYRERDQPARPAQGGIGITTEAEPGGLRVVRVFEGSPAAHAGLRPGDLVLKVGSTSLADQAENLGAELIRGPVGTMVQLTFRRGDVEHGVAIERANIAAPVAGLQMLTYHEVRIGHLMLTGFSEGSGDELRTQVRAALDAGAQALVLDLRGNGGGLISEAINVASAFIAHGEIMSTEERGRARRVYTARGDAIAADIPMVVLVDHGTASSAEIVTAALQDSGRAEVVGTETYGKGVFQITEPLINDGALDITVGKYFTPNGHNLGGGGASPGPGITPNVEAVDDPQTPSDEALTVAERTVAAKVQ